MPDVSYPTPAGLVPAYFATPLGGGPWPGVVVIHDAFGLGDDIRQQADRLATAGYLALAPDLYSYGRKLPCVRATFAALRARQGRAFDDIEAARAWLAARAGSTGRVGVIGFCMGGGFALLCAPRYDFAAASVNYGQVPGDADRLLAGSCPIVGSFGGRDRGLRGHAPRLQQALESAGVPHDVREYPDAAHGFLNRFNLGPFTALARVTGLGYHHPSAEDAWRRIFAFFDQHLRRTGSEAPTDPPPSAEPIDDRPAKGSVFAAGHGAGHSDTDHGESSGSAEGGHTAR
jgi:carboxymethylenebutenolidase